MQTVTRLYRRLTGYAPRLMRATTEPRYHSSLCGGAAALTPTAHHPNMLSQRIQQHFIDSADLNYQCAQLLAAPVDAAVTALLAGVTSGGKVLACGLGGSAAAAQYFTARFVGRFERDRPELAATALSAAASDACSDRSSAMS